MNNEFETMKTELNKKIEIFKKEADKYDGRLVYTITAVRVTYNRDQEYVRVSEPRNAQKCFSDFSSALEAFLALSKKPQMITITGQVLRLIWTAVIFP